jgi:hypothetical protein
MGYNLWLSEDSHYTLGFRMGTQACETPAPREARAGVAAQVSRGAIEPIDLLIEKLARQFDATTPTPQHSG